MFLHQRTADKLPRAAKCLMTVAREGCAFSGMFRAAKYLHPELAAADFWHLFLIQLFATKSKKVISFRDATNLSLLGVLRLDSMLNQRLNFSLKFSFAWWNFDKDLVPVLPLNFGNVGQLLNGEPEPGENNHGAAFPLSLQLLNGQSYTCS